MGSCVTSLRLIAPFAALSLMAAHCEPRTDLVIVNKTNQTIEIMFTDGSGDEIIIHELDPGDTAFSHLECIDPDLTARTLDGTVLAQQPGPICQGDAP